MWGNLQVLVIEKGRGLAHVSDTGGTSDAMDVFINIVAQVIVDDVHHVLDVQSTRGNGCGNEDGAAAIPKRDINMRKRKTSEYG